MDLVVQRSLYRTTTSLASPSGRGRRDRFSLRFRPDGLALRGADAAGEGPFPFPSPFPFPLPFKISVSVIVTSAIPIGARLRVPLKITSSILSPRSDFALCSPSTQATASDTLLFPQPFGPTMAVTPVSCTVISTRSENDL